MAIIDPERIADLIVECAGLHIVPRFQALRDDEISTKTSPTDLVTQADIDAEAFLEKVLPDLYPGSLMIGEEGISRGDHSLDALGQAERGVFVVDPVDGTSNFVNNKAEFGVMVAYVVAGVVENAWIYDVPAQKMHMAERGAGAFVDGVRHRVSSQRDVSKMIGHINAKFFPKELQPILEERMELFGDYKSLGAAAHEYTRVAAGQSDVILYSRLKPWDHLPGSLLVREAGGVVKKWDGHPYEVQDHYAGLIVTNSEESWQAIYDAVFEGIDLSRYF